MGRHAQKATPASAVSALFSQVGTGNVVYRAGGVAMALSLAVSGGAFAAVQMNNGVNTDANKAALTHAALGLSAQPTSNAEESVNYKLVVDGKTISASTQADTWGQALSDAGVSVDDNDTASVDLTAAPVDGAVVTVVHASVTQTNVDTAIKAGTTEKPDPTLAKGEKKVETEGVDGISRTVYNVVTRGGKEVSRTVVSTAVVKPATNAVVLVGTKEATAPAATTPATPNNSSSSSSGGNATLAAAGTDAASAQAIAKSMMSSYGWDDTQFSCLVKLWNRESGWNYQAYNASSGATGIPQALPGSKMASAGSDWATNPATQIKWGLGYISERYSNPCGAWAHSESVGWY